MAWFSGKGKERDRLAGMYGEMGDGELLRLAASPGDLTEAAQAALAGEMKARGLTAPVEVEEVGRADGGDPGAGMRTLHVFSQTFEAQAAFRVLERDGIEFVVEDRTVDGDGQMVEGPSVQLALMVDARDWERSVLLLRREAGLFPEAVVDPGGEGAGEEGELVAVGEFEEAEDARSAGQVLGEAGVWFEAVLHDGEDWERTSIEVRVEDQDRALAALATLLEGDDTRRL